MNRKTSLLAGVFAAVAGTLACSGANATLLNFDLNFNFGAVDAQGNVLVSITEAPTAGNVRITVTNNTQGFINDLWLNYSPNANLAGSTIMNFSATTGIVSSPSVALGVQGFAIDFGYETANNSGRFTNGESVMFDLDATAALTVSGFNTLGGGPIGDDYYAAAHVNAVAALGQCLGGSAKVGDINGGNVAGGGNGVNCNPPGGSTPEPGSLALVGLGAAGLGAFRRRRKLFGPNLGDK